MLHIIEGGAFMAAMVFLDQYTVMIGFIQKLSKNPLIISLIPAALVIGFNTPGLFTAQMIQRIQNKHRFVAITGLFQRLMILLLAAFTLGMGNLPPTTAGIVSAFIFFLFAGIGGSGGPAWLDLLMRTVPPGRRSRVIALRNAIGAGAGIIFPVFIAYILKTRPFPESYRILFLTACGFFTVSWIGFVMLKDLEVPLVAETSRQKFSAFIKALPGSDPNFIRFLLSRILFGFCLITTSFYTVYYLSSNEGIDDSVVATFALAMNVSKIFGGLFLGHLADKKGNLLIYKIGILLIIPANLLILYSPSLPVFIGVFVLFGLTFAADTNTYQSFIGEFGTPLNRVFYTTLGSSVAGTFAGILPIVAGILLKLGYVRYQMLFLFCASLAVLCFLYVQAAVKAPLVKGGPGFADLKAKEENTTA